LLSARASVAKHFGSEESKLTSSDVILTHGANMGLFNLLLSILNPGDNILVPEPGYPFFHLTAPVWFLSFSDILFILLNDNLTFFPCFLMKF